MKLEGDSSNERILPRQSYLTLEEDGPAILSWWDCKGVKSAMRRCGSK
jgi:hypothetical protein